jgi:hypothetical protein
VPRIVSECSPHKATFARSFVDPAARSAHAYSELTICRIVISIVTDIVV